MKKNLPAVTFTVIFKNYFVQKLFFVIAICFSFVVHTNAQTASFPCASGTLTNQNGYYGGFEAGGTNGDNNFLPGAASTQYTYGNGQKEYQILSNTIGQSGYLPLLPHSGSYFLTSHISSNSSLKLWYKTLAVSPGQKIQVCAWIANLKVNPVGGFPVNIVVNTGTTSTVIATKTAVTNVWEQICGFYTVPAGVFSIEVEINDPTPTFNGSSHYLALDDICITDLTPRTNPDFNSTFVNVAVSGNVSTNDVVPAGTTYGTTPTLVSSPAGSAATLTMNSNGTYSFTANTPGVYTYDVQVCVPGQTTPCPTTKLVITVINANVITNAPVANVDIATTNLNTAVTLRTLANDAAGNANTALVPSSVTVTSAPTKGIATVNATTGDITYTPNAGFSGRDTLTYQVCDNQTPAKCATAVQIITVNAAGTPNSTTAADDYKITSINTAATGNVKTNDSDAEGNTQTVTAQTTTVAGKGTLVLNTDGSYTFTPVTGFTGPVDFPYTTCDNGTPQACATATLHILVRPVAPSTNPDFNTTFVNVAVPGNVNTNDNVPAGTTYGTTPTLLSSPAGSTATLTMNSNGTYSFTANTPGVYTYDVPVCVPGQSSPCPLTKLVITVLNVNSNTNAPVANVDVATTNLNTAVTLRTLSNDAAGNANTALVPSSVTVTSAPTRGTATVNPTTGDITYTPNAGFSGRDTLTYQVCDNQTPAKCATALQIITVNAAGTPNSTTAADDYKITSINTAATGNVKTNDSDAEGNTQTVTAQTTLVAGKGTLVLNTDGSYTFTPVTGFTGPVDFPYTTCDNGTPQACAKATLHILVQPMAAPDLTPRINLNPNNIIGRSSLEITVQVNELRNIVTNGSVITMYVDKQNFFSNFSFNSVQTVNIAGQLVQNSLFTVDAVSNPDFYVITTSAVFANSLRRFTFSVTVNPGQTKGATPLNVYLLNGSGGETNFTNNSNSTFLTFSF